VPFQISCRVLGSDHGVSGSYPYEWNAPGDQDFPSRTALSHSRYNRKDLSGEVYSEQVRRDDPSDRTRAVRPEIGHSYVMI
jgi:hypothetical protein